MQIRTVPVTHFDTNKKMKLKIRARQDTCSINALLNGTQADPGPSDPGLKKNWGVVFVKKVGA